MKCLIKGIEYDVVEGATFCDEYNEKLSSGSIILSHIPKTEFAPYDDVYIYLCIVLHLYNDFHHYKDKV